MQTITISSRRLLSRRRFPRASVLGFFSALLLTLAPGIASADGYDDMWVDAYYITQASTTSANPTMTWASDKAGYGVLNDWRIGSGQADFVQPGEAAIGIIGLLYADNRMRNANRIGSLDSKLKTALSGFFWSWIRNQSNWNGSAYPANIAYDAAGNKTSDSGGDARVTAELLIAMRKYCLLSPNGDRSNYQSQMYSRAHDMADYINANMNSWTIDRSYYVASFHAFANWAKAMGYNDMAVYYNGRADLVSGWLASAQDTGAWHNYYAYLDGTQKGTYNRGVDQTGFAPYEFSARPPGEAFAMGLADWWNHGQASNGVYLTQQSGPYAGGVHQWVPFVADDFYNKVYPGSALQIADALWKIAGATNNYHNLYAEAWNHYNFAKFGSGNWVNNWTTDPASIGGFIDWVNVSNNFRPASWQRFVDTSGYFLIATEELVFNHEVNWGE